MASNKFKGVKEAKTKNSSEYFHPGRYIVQIEAVKATSNYKREEFTVVEMQTIHAFEDSERGVNEHGSEIPLHRAGDSVSYLMKVQSEYYLSDFKTFACAAGDMTAEELTEERCAEIEGDKNPLGGVFVEVLVKQSVSKKEREAAEKEKRAPRAFTRVTWVRQVPPSEVVELAGDGITDLVPNIADLLKAEAA